MENLNKFVSQPWRSHSPIAIRPQKWFLHTECALHAYFAYCCEWCQRETEQGRQNENRKKEKKKKKELYAKSLPLTAFLHTTFPSIESLKTKFIGNVFLFVNQYVGSVWGAPTIG